MENTTELTLRLMTLTIEEIGPENAPVFLARNACNRPYRAKTGEQYARDMTAGVWREKPIPICLDVNGNLINGQHTLNALVLSGKSYQFLVARDVPNDVAAILDRGLGRSLSDVAHFFGLNIAARVFAIARGLEFGISDRQRRSFDEQMVAIEKHRAVLDWIMERKPAPWIKPTTLVAIGRAWHTQDRQRLAEFVELLETGMANGPQDSAAILLRNYYLNPKAKWIAKRTSLALYQKTESALCAFLERTEQKLLKGTAEELFPLPGEAIISRDNSDAAAVADEAPGQIITTNNVAEPSPGEPSV